MCFYTGYNLKLECWLRKQKIEKFDYLIGPNILQLFWMLDVLGLINLNGHLFDANVL